MSLFRSALVASLQAEIAWLRKQLEEKVGHERAVARVSLGMPEAPKQKRAEDPDREAVKALCGRFELAGDRLWSEAQEANLKGVGWDQILDRMRDDMERQLDGTP